jgi:hypothetical protein
LWSWTTCQRSRRGGQKPCAGPPPKSTTKKRKLYTDDDIHVKAFRRCVVLNGVTLGGMLRPDLLERTMAFDLEVRPSD